MKTLHIGTSGWFYEYWKEVFYPKQMPQDQRLKYYSTHFSTVEINSTFYHMPLEKSVSHWYECTPKDFLFAVKASRYLTHLKMLNDCEEPLNEFIKRVSGLKEKLGPILFQLPPKFQKNEKRLRDFLALLPKNYLYCIEFRHASWECDSIYEILAHQNVALCISDLNQHLTPFVFTAPFTYIRLHGPQKAYYGSYSEEQLQLWKKCFNEWLKEGKSVYCYFDNDEKTYAIENALKLEDYFQYSKSTPLTP